MTYRFFVRNKLTYKSKWRLLVKCKDWTNGGKRDGNEAERSRNRRVQLYNHHNLSQLVAKKKKKYIFFLFTPKRSRWTPCFTFLAWVTHVAKKSQLIGKVRGINDPPKTVSKHFKVEWPCMNMFYFINKM